jgi:hypothetical protein
MRKSLRKVAVSMIRSLSLGGTVLAASLRERVAEAVHEPW